MNNSNQEISMMEILDTIRYLDAYYLYMGKQFMKDYVNDICERNDSLEIKKLICVCKMDLDRPWSKWFSTYVLTRINFS